MSGGVFLHWDSCVGCLRLNDQQKGRHGPEKNEPCNDLWIAIGMVLDIEGATELTWVSRWYACLNSACSIALDTWEGEMAGVGAQS